MDLSANEGEMPIPITSSYVGGSHGPSHNSNSITHRDSLPLQHLHPSNGPPLPSLPLHSPTPLSSAAPFISKKGMVVKYRECLKNHAASIGGNATDGCGEFMPSGDEGTLEALKCSACNCHRNFHRKEIDENPYSSRDCINFEGGRKLMIQKGVLISGAADPFGYNPRPSPHQMIMPLCSMQTSGSDEMEGVGGVIARPLMVKKRFRTKFTPEQKEKMLGFAEKVGWRLQKQEDILVQQLCQEIGVKRSVLKVWMHNNKHNLAKKTSNLQLE